MSRLDDVFDRYFDDEADFVMRPKFNQQIKDLMLEVISEAQADVAHDNRDTVYGFSMLSSKLRQKVREL